MKPIINNTLKQAIRTLIGIILIIGMFYFFGFQESIDTLLSIDPTYIILAYIAHSTTWFTRTLRLVTFFKDHDIKYKNKKEIFKINLSGYTMNLILPFKLGDIARIYMFHTEEKAPLKKSATIVAYTRIFDILTLAIIGIISITLLLEESTSDMTRYFYIFIILALPITALTSSRIQNYLASLIENQHPQLAGLIISFKLSRKARINALFYSSLIWIADGITIYLIFKGLDQNVSIALVMLGLVVGNLVKSIPTTPGGIGLFEGTMAFLFISFGINQSIAIVTSTVDHFVKNSTTLLLGVPSMMTYRIDMNRLKELSKSLFRQLGKVNVNEN